MTREFDGPMLQDNCTASRPNGAEKIVVKRSDIRLSSWRGSMTPDAKQRSTNLANREHLDNGGEPVVGVGELATLDSSDAVVQGDACLAWLVAEAKGVIGGCD